jgi:hypothetical protein
VRELDEQCARAMGWGPVHEELDPQKSKAWRVLPGGWRAPDGTHHRTFHRFSINHAAARLLENEIERRGDATIRRYIAHLMEIIDAVPFDDSLWLWQAIRATPEQRCRAFLEATT